MQSDKPMDPEHVAGLLDEVSSLREGTRAELRSDQWQWLWVWAAVCLGAGASVYVPGLSEYSGFYWILAVPLGLAATVLIERRIEERRSVRLAGWPFWTTGVGIGVLNFGGSLVLSTEVLVVFIWVVLAAGFGVLAWLGRLRWPAGFFFGLSVMSAVLGFLVEDTFELYPILGFLFAAAITGIVVGIKTEQQTR